MPTPPNPGRRTLPHHAPLEIPNRSIIIFVTQVVQDRRPLLGRAEAVQTLLRSWAAADNWLVGRYVIMPDHVHFFCAPRNKSAPLAQWMRFWRSQSTKSWPWPEEKPIWQKDFFDRQLREADSYGEKWNYVRNNPVRKGLAPNADAWPWQGELNVLLWHDPA